MFLFKWYQMFFFLNFEQRYFLFHVSPNVIPASPPIILRCWKLDTGFAISPHRHRHHQFVTPLCAQVLSVPISPVLSHPPLRCCMHVLFGYQLSPDILVPLSLPACERICCHLCIPTIIFWRFSPSQWKTECVWKLREISVMLPEWQLWQTGCISFRAIYMSYLFLSALKVITYKKISPLNLHHH